MGLFKRASWHSGLTYQQTCRNCNTTINYTDKSLDFRPWYPNGYVYCPKCKTPLRHSEDLAITTKEQETVNITNQTKPQTITCVNCGVELSENQNFCPYCGTKRA